jgi:GTPase
VKQPMVAIVGAPNVGKSRLFNRLTGSQRSIVHDHPGVTRDRILGVCEWAGRPFNLLDTGGLIPGSPDKLTAGVERQVLRGIREADLLVFVVDGRAGLTPLDERLGALFRKSSRPLLLAVNKLDSPELDGLVAEFFSLGFGDPLPISAEEGRGVGGLLDAIHLKLPSGVARRPDEGTEAPPAASLAIVGRPNVGKSTLFNLLLGDERSLVSAVPGTTRDPVDAEFTHGGRRYRIVDTAGLRRKHSRGEEVEAQSVARALAALKLCDLAIILMDATEPITHQDLAVVGACQKVRRPAVVVLNKIDLLAGGARHRSALLREARNRLQFAEAPPLMALSALRGEGVKELLDRLGSMAEETTRRFPTGDLNRALSEAVRRRSPSGKDKIPRLYYITQTGGSPPSFVVFTNGAIIDSTYRRYLARHLRDALGLVSTPVSLRFRARPTRT